MTAEPTEIVPYVYSADGYRDQLLSFNNMSIDYDKIGNPSIYKNVNLQWGNIRQLLKYGELSSYQYLPNGTRVSNTVGEVVTTYYAI